MISTKTRVINLKTGSIIVAVNPGQAALKRQATDPILTRTTTRNSVANAVAVVGIRKALLVGKNFNRILNY